MKISKTIQTFPDTRIQDKPLSIKTSAHFEDMLQNSNRKFSSERLNQLLGEIESQGKRLSTAQTVKDLHQYKNLIKDFVKEAINFGMQLSQNKNWDQQGHARTHTLVKQVDQQLIELTDHILNKEKKQIDVLNKIGEIHGLLINLYT